MAADIFNCPIACPSVEEAAAFGAALQAWWMRLSSRGAPPSIGELAMKHVKKSGDAVAPDPESAEVYTSVYNEYLDYVALLTPHFTRDK
jgi:xylulokinase